MTVPDTPATTGELVEPVRRDWLLATGMILVGLAAAASSFSGLFDLAHRTGWLIWLCALLPLTVDAYAMTATRVWLAKSTRNSPARRWAKVNAIGAITVSVAGNAVDHALTAGVFPLGWPLVVAVSAIPPVVLGLLVHMAHLRTLPPTGTATATTPSTPANDTPADSTRQAPESAIAAPLPAPTPAPPAPAAVRQARRPLPEPKTRKALPPGKSDAELIAAARQYAATGHEASATWLMKTFGIGTRRAARIRDAAQIPPSSALAPVPDSPDPSPAPVDLAKNTPTPQSTPDTDEESAA